MQMKIPLLTEAHWTFLALHSKHSRLEGSSNNAWNTGFTACIFFFKGQKFCVNFFLEGKNDSICGKKI